MSDKRKFNKSCICLYNSYVLNEAPLLRAAAIPVPADFDPTSKKSFTLPPPASSDEKCGSIGILLLGYFVQVNPAGSPKDVFFNNIYCFPSDSTDTFPVNNDPSPILLNRCY